MLLKVISLAALTVSSYVHLACADEMEGLKSEATFARAVVYTPQNICLALVRTFALQNESPTVSEVVDDFGDDCGDHIRAGEYRNNNWIITSSLVPERPNEIEASIAGPAAELSQFAPAGYELYIFRLVLFFDTELELQPYIYYRTSRYNLRSLSELDSREHRDNVVMDPYEEWQRNFLPRLNSAISEVAVHRISEARITD